MFWVEGFFRGSQMAEDDRQENKTERVQLLMTPTEVEMIDDWMFRNRMRSRAEAIRRLTASGIELDARLDEMTKSLLEEMGRLDNMSKDLINKTKDVIAKKESGQLTTQEALRFSVDCLLAAQAYDDVAWDTVYKCRKLLKGSASEMYGNPLRNLLNRAIEGVKQALSRDRVPPAADQ